MFQIVRRGSGDLNLVSRSQPFPPDESPKRRIALMLSCLALIACVQPVGLSACKPPEPGAAPRVLAEFPIRRRDSLWIVDALVGGKTYQMVLDTGTSATIFDVAHRRLLGRVVATMNLNPGSQTPELSRLEVRESPVITLGGIELRPPHGAGCIDLGFVTIPNNGAKIDGVLGMDVLRRTTFEVDPDLRTIRFYTGASDVFGTATPIVWSTRPSGQLAVPMLRTTLADGTAHDFLIDSGMNGDTLDGLFAGSLGADRYDELIRRGKLSSREVVFGVTTYTFGDNGEGHHAFAGATSLSLGRFSHPQLIFFRDDRLNTLGLGYLSRYRVTFDFPNDTVYLQPSRSHARDDFYDLSGMRIKMNGASAEVTWVRKESPAANAGLVAGDIISAINGEPTAEMTDLAVRELLATKGRHVLDVRRGNDERQVVLDLGANSVHAEPPQARQLDREARPLSTTSR